MNKEFLDSAFVKDEPVLQTDRQTDRQTDTSRSSILRFLIFLLYISLVSFVSYHHEAWQDEADSYLMARDLSFLELFSYMKYTGTGVLWYFIIAPFAKLGFGYECQTIIHIIIASFVAYHFLYKYPFSLLISTLIIFSYPLGYEYAVIARPYSLGILCLIICAEYFSRRLEKPFFFYIPIILAVYSNLYSAIIALSIFCLSLIEDFKSFKFENIRTNKNYLCVVFASMLCFIVLMLPPNDRQVVHSALGQDGILFGATLLIYSSLYGMFFKSGNVVSLLLILSSISFYLLIKYSNNKKFIIPTIIFLTVLFFTIRMAGPRHSSHLLVVILISPFIKKTVQAKYFCNFVKFTIGISVVLTGYYYYLDYRYPFSNSKNMARIINNLDLDKNNIIFADRLNDAESVLAYLHNQTKFFYLSQNRVGSHMTWDVNYVKALFIKERKIVNRLKRRIMHSKSDNNYFLSTFSLRKYKLNKDFNVKLLGRSIGRNFDYRKNDRFYFYKISKK